MTRKAFRITGPLRGKSIGHWWIPLAKGQYAEFSLYCRPEQTVNIETIKIKDSTLIRSNTCIKQR